MKRTTYFPYTLLFFLVLPFITFSQIRVDTVGLQTYYIENGQKVAMDDRFISDVKEPPSMGTVKVAFRTFNFQGLEKRFSPVLWDEIVEIESLLRSYTPEFNASKRNGVYEDASVGWGTRGTVGETTFYSLSEELPNLSISYTYREIEGEPQIETLVISRAGTIVKRFPALYDVMKEKLANIDKVDNQPNNLKKIEVYVETIRYIEEKLPFLNSVLPNPKQTLSSFQGSLSWFYNLEGNGVEAVKYAKSGLGNHPEHVWINTNLALGYLLSGQVEEARKIYVAHKDTPFRGGTLKNMFKQDILDVEANGVSVLGKEMVMDILK